MNKKFEYVDDNPGSYFEMLVENWENLNEDKKNLRNWIEKKVGKQMSNMKPTKIGYKHGRPYYSVDFVDGTSDDYFIDFDKKEIEKCESLKEDKDELSIVGEFETGEDFGQKAGTSKKNQAIFRAKALMKMRDLSRAKVINAKGNVVWDSDTMLKEDKFVPQDKMSKKAQKELNDKKRGTWGNTNPVTKVQPNKKAYDRKRDKKVVDEALNIGYWSEDSWGSDYPPDNWEEVVSRANEMIKNKYLQTRDEEETRDYSSKLWDGYCKRAKQLEKQKDRKVVNEI